MPSGPLTAKAVTTSCSVDRGKAASLNLSERDLQTIDALYRLPNGATVQ